MEPIAYSMLGHSTEEPLVEAIRTTYVEEST